MTELTDADVRLRVFEVLAPGYLNGTRGLDSLLFDIGAIAEKIGAPKTDPTAQIRQALFPSHDFARARNDDTLARAARRTDRVVDYLMTGKAPGDADTGAPQDKTED